MRGTTIGSVSKRAMLLWLAAILSTTSGLAVAQYKSIGPDGRVTYSDRPPPPDARIVGKRDMGTAPPTPGLPFELQQAMEKFPVTLYTGEQCGACDQGRNYLRERGIPYTEKTVKSNEDIALLTRLSPESTIPVLTVGSQRRIGYSILEWRTTLDAAGYPPASRLPVDYANPPPQSAAPPAAPPATATAAPEQDIAPPGESDTSNEPSNAPPGFRF